MFEIVETILIWRVIEGGQVLGRVFVTFSEVVELVGTPAWTLIDSLGNDHKCIWATPHISDIAERVDFVVANFHASPAFGPYALSVPAGDPAVKNNSAVEVPGGVYGIPLP